MENTLTYSRSSFVIAWFLAFFVFPVGLFAQQLSYVALKKGSGRGEVVIIDTDAQAEIGRFSTNDLPRGITLNSTGTEVWVSAEGANTVQVFSTTSPYSEIASIPTGVEPYGVTLNPSNSKAYVVNAGDSTVTVIDAITYSVITTLPTNDASVQPIVNRDGSKVFISNRGVDPTVTVIDGVSDTLITNIVVGKEPYGMALSVTGDTLFVADRGRDEIHFIDTQGDSILLTIETPGEEHIGMTISLDGNSLYTTTENNNVLKVDVATGSVLKTIPVGNIPWGISRSRDGSTVSVAIWGSKWVQLISTATDTVVQTISETGYRNVVGFGDFTGYIHADFPTPVEWLSFEAERKDEGMVQLRWSTATETNNEGFMIERTFDGQLWEKVGYVPGKGDRQEVTNYQFLDPAPHARRIAYRIMQFDFDGGYDYSSLVELAPSVSSNLMAYPVPFNDRLHVATEPGTVSLMNLQGQTVARYTTETGAVTIESPDLPPGMYVLYLTRQDGTTLSKKVLKN